MVGRERWGGGDGEGGGKGEVGRGRWGGRDGEGMVVRERWGGGGERWGV